MKKRRKSYRGPKPVMSWLPRGERLDIAIMSHTMINKLASGLFDDLDANSMAYLINVVRRLGVQGGNQGVVDGADFCMEAFLAIRQRQLRMEVWGAAGPELVILKSFFPVLTRWFNAQPVHRIAYARIWVLEINQRMQAEGLLSADVRDDGRLENGVAVGAPGP